MDEKDIRVETPLTSYLFSKASVAKIPLSGTFELSPVCNFDCQMCYVKKSVDEVTAHERSIMALEQWLTIARTAKDNGLLYLLLTGGEPFLWPDFWELYEELSKMGLLISINTNGSLIDESVVEKLKQMPPTRINITLYGASDETYEKLCHVKGVFSKVDKAVNLLLSAGITVKLNGSLTPCNVHDLNACVAYAKEKGLIYETNTYMFPPVRRDESMIGINQRFTPREAAYYRMKSYHLQFGDERYEQYLQSISSGYVLPLGLDDSCVDLMNGEIRCRAGKSVFWITWDGWMTPCGMMNEPKVDIKKQSFTSAWKALVEISEKSILSGLCGQCQNRGLCHSCAAMALAETGKLTGVPTYLCKMVEEMKRLTDEDLLRLYKRNEQLGGNKQ